MVWCGLVVAHLQIGVKLLHLMVGTPLVLTILNSQTLSYRVTLVEGFPILVEQARHPGCIWAKYFDVVVDVSGADVLRKPFPDVSGPKTSRQSLKHRAMRDAHHAPLQVEFEEDTVEEEAADASDNPVNAGDSSKADFAGTPNKEIMYISYEDDDNVGGDASDDNACAEAGGRHDCDKDAGGGDCGDDAGGV